MAQPKWFGPPAGKPRLLNVAPALASWDKAGSPSQLRSSVFIDEVYRVLAVDIASVSGPLGLALDVGLDTTAPLFVRNDLDNFLFPLVSKLTERSGREFATVHATKRHGASSTVRVGPAKSIPPPAEGYLASIKATGAASTTGYKEQIRDQLVGAEPLPGEGVRADLAFLVGPGRAWPNLWKATIDSLGRLLGRDAGAGEWNARDGRITDLGLHCTVDPAVGNDVKIELRVASTQEFA